MRASDSMVKPIPIKSMDWDQSKKEPMAPISIKRIPNEKKEITLLFISGLFSVEWNEIGNGIIEARAEIIDEDPLEPWHIEVFEIVRLVRGEQDVAPE